MLIIVIIIVCAGIGYYMYNFMKKDSTKFIPNNEFSSIDPKPEGQLILFYVNWCPHSQTALTTWNVIKQKYSNPKYIISFSETDCDQYEQIASEFNITEYPTILLVKNSNNYEYDSNLSEESLNLFINTVMK